MYGTEEMRIAVLKAYIDSADYDSRHDRFVIDELKNAGYLRCGVDPLTDAETIRTTSFGELYLRNNGHGIRRPFVRRFVNRVKRT